MYSAASSPEEVDKPSLHNLMSLDKFRKLSEEEKNEEVLRLIPLLKPFAAKFQKDLSGLTRGLGSAGEKLDALEVLETGDNYWRRWIKDCWMMG